MARKVARTISASTISMSNLLSRLEERINGTETSVGLNALQAIRLQEEDRLYLVVATPATTATKGSPEKEAQFASVTVTDARVRDGSWDELQFRLERPSRPSLHARVRLSLGQLTAVPFESRGFGASDILDQRTGVRNAIWNPVTLQTRSAQEILDALMKGVRVDRVYLGKVDGITRHAYRFTTL